jgi:protein-S-isoprenylcysteine O-methyltransferase Ste14
VNSAPSSSYLRPITRIFWVLLTLSIGVVPSILFWGWIERNAALPAAFYRELGWPWLTVWDAPLALKIGIDFALFFGFGFFHSLLAQKPVQTVLKKVVPAQCIRAFYLCFCGLTVLLLMGCWQNTGVLLWVVPGLSAQTLSLLSIIIYWSLLALCARILSQFDTLEFFGFRQIYSKQDQVDKMSAGGAVLQTGYFAKMRHPIYFFSLLAIVLTPMMSLDRFIIFSASVLYLFFAIPVEERKLEARFGEAYRAYKAKVPAVLPRIST